MVVTALRFRSLVASLFLAVGSAQPVVADGGGVILTVTSGSSSVTFGREDLERMRQVTYRTTTIWTDGVQEFRGVPLDQVLKQAGATGTRIILGATNDYAAELPVDTISADVPIIALTVNGVPMTLRDKGPLWVVYPYDDSRTYQSEVIYTRSVWQLDRIEVLP